MSQRLLRKSRTNQGDQSQSQSHTSPIQGDDQIRNFRIEFQDMSRKRLSDSDVKDPTIYSQRKSRLSQFSNINNNGRQKEASEQNLTIQQHTAATKYYYQLKWKELSGLPKQTNLSQIIQTFLSKLKINANIWDSNFMKLDLLKESYLIEKKKIQESSIYYLRQYLYFIKLISFFTIPLTAGTTAINVWFQTLIIIFNIIGFIDSIINKLFNKIEFCCNLLFIISSILLNIDISISAKYVFLIISLIGLKGSFQKNLFIILLYPCLYFNYFGNFWLLIKENEINYLDSLVWIINNSLPFNSIQQIDEVATIITIIIQLLSYFIQIAFISYIIKTYFQTDELSIFTKYLSKIQVNKALINEAESLLQEQQSPNELKIANQLIQQLPYTLQRPLNFYIKSKKLKEITFFNKFSKDFIELIAQESQLKFFNANDIIVEKKQINESIYVVLKGEAEVYDGDIFLDIVPSTQAIGIDNLVTHFGHDLTIRSRGNSILIHFTHQQFKSIIRKIKPDLETYHTIRNEVLYQYKFEQLQQCCLICKSQFHLTSSCNKVHMCLNKNLVMSRHLHSIPNQRKKIDRKWEQRVNSLSNLILVRSCGKKFKKNYGLISDSSEQQDQIYEEDEEVEDEYQYGYMSYKDLTNPSKVTSSNIEKQKSVEVVSGQTLKEIIYQDHYDNEEQWQQYYYQQQILQQQQQQLQQQEINRHSIVKQTLQTAGFQQNEDLHFAEGSINIPYQHRIITQNSNTIRSSSGQNTYQSQKSQQLQKQQQQTQQGTSPHAQQSKTYVQSPITANQLMVGGNRNQQPKFTFSYDPLQYEPKHLTQVAINQDYQNALRPQIRSSTNFVPSGTSQLPAVPEESNSQLNIPFVNGPLASAMSISSVGMSSIDDYQRKEQQNNTYTGVRRATQQKQTNTFTSAISPDNTKKKSISGSNSRTYSALSSKQNQHYSDLDNLLHKVDIKDNFDIDQVEIYDQFKPLNNYDCVVNQFRIQSNKLIKSKKKNK